MLPFILFQRPRFHCFRKSAIIDCKWKKKVKSDKDCQNGQKLQCHGGQNFNNKIAHWPPGRAISGQNSNNYGRLFLVPNFGCNIINHTITRTSEACNMLYFDPIIKVKRMKWLISGSNLESSGTNFQFWILIWFWSDRHKSETHEMIDIQK